MLCTLMTLGACNTIPEQQPNGAGWPCKATDECRRGLTCEVLGEVTDASRCQVDLSFCSVTCKSDRDCVTLGDFHCEGTCGGKNICVGP